MIFKEIKAELSGYMSMVYSVPCSSTVRTCTVGQHDRAGAVDVLRISGIQTAVVDVKAQAAAAGAGVFRFGPCS